MLRSRWTRWCHLAALMLLVMACRGAGGAPPPAAPSPPLTRAAAEAALLASPAWRAEVDIRAEGEYPAELTAAVEVATGNRVRIDARGTFMGAPVELSWVSDGARTSTGAATPPATAEAIAIGVARMGLLHNLARLIAGAPDPDHAAGGAAEWVVVTDEQAADAGVTRYGLTVAGVPSAEVEVEVTGSEPRFARRRIVVHFDGGEMTVVENYRFTLEHRPAADTFALPGPR